jgi:hypothetical protein
MRGDASIYGGYDDLSGSRKTKMLVMGFDRLSRICKKLAEESAVPEKLRVEARKFDEG